MEPWTRALFLIFVVSFVDGNFDDDYDIEMISYLYLIPNSDPIVIPHRDLRSIFLSLDFRLRL